LLAHTCTDFGREIENGTEAKITTLSALVVFAMLDPATTENGIHASVDIFVQVQALLSFGDATTSRHENAVQEIRMAIMELASNLGESTRE
jgi:hypothetical protein